MQHLQRLQRVGVLRSSAWFKGGHRHVRQEPFALLGVARVLTGMDGIAGCGNSTIPLTGDGHCLPMTPWRRFSHEFPWTATIVTWLLDHSWVLLLPAIILLLFARRSGEREQQLRSRGGCGRAFLRVATLPRAVFSAVILYFLVNDYLYGDWDGFTVTSASTRGVFSARACLQECMLTHSDPLRESFYGGTGVCKKSDAEGNEESTVEFRVCGLSWTAGERCRKVQSWIPTKRHEYTVCSFQVAVGRWKPDFAFYLLCISSFLLVDGVPADQVMVGTAMILVMAGVITMDMACSGFTAEVLPVILFYPIMEAVTQTGLLERCFLPLLGKPAAIRVALTKLYVLSAVLSIFIGNTPLVMMLLPLVAKWCRTVGYPIDRFLMPMVNAVLCGSCMSMMGSISGILTQALSKPHVFDMLMFDTFITGLATTIPVAIVCIVLAPTSCLRSGSAKGTSSETAESWIELGERGLQKPGEYTVAFEVVQAGTVDGQPMHPLVFELRSITGVSHVQVQGNDNGPCLNEVGGLTRSFLGKDHIIVSGTPEGLAQVRCIDGIQALNHADFLALGSHRRGRQLWEATVAANIGIGEDGPLKSLSACSLRQRLGLTLFAARRQNSVPPWSPGLADEQCLRAGDVVLFETHLDDIECGQDLLYKQVFTVMRPIPNSLPPRQGISGDTCKSVFVCSVFALMLVLVSVGWVDLDLASGMAVMVLVLTRQLKWQDVLRSINPHVILFVCAGVGVATAVPATGIAHAMSDAIKDVAGQYGIYGRTAAIYCITLGLGLFLGQGALVPMVMPIVWTLVDESSLDHKDARALLHVMMFASTCEFMSPLGSIPQYLIIPPGGHTYLDFVIFGFIPQLVHALACIFLVPHLLT